MKLGKEILQVFAWTLLTLLTFKTLDICMANEVGESLNTKSSTNQFYYDGRQHDLPTITITSDSEIEKNGSYWKIFNFPNSSGLEDEKFLLAIEAESSFPLYIFYELATISGGPYSLQKRNIQDYWNKSSYVFQVFVNVKASYFMLRNSSFELRSNVDPFFGISVRYYFDRNENTVNIQTNPEIPFEFNDYFNRLHQRKDKNCKAHLLVQQDFEPGVGVFERNYDCYFADGEKGFPGIILTTSNLFYISRYYVDQRCIVWCKDDPKCEEKNLWSFSYDYQWTSNSFCKRQPEDDLSEAFLFSPLYVSLPQGKDKAADIYFDIGSVNMEKMISMDPFDEYQKNGSLMEIRCTISEGVAGIPFRFALKRKNIELIFLPVLDVTSFGSEDYSRSTIYKFKIKYTDIERVFCFAPVLGSYDWINASRPIHVTALSTPMFLHGMKSSNGTFQTLINTFNIVKEFYVGTNEVLMCKATGEPSPEISWTWNKQKVTESTGEWKPHQATWSQLWFPSVDKTMGGEYICKATNSLGVAAATFIVKVVENFDPTITISVTLAVIVLVAVATVIVIKIMRSTSRRSRDRILTEKECQDFLRGKKETNTSDPNSEIFSKAFDAKFIIERSRLKLNTESVLGSGQYGIVMKGWLTDELDVVTMVAVKTTKEDVDVMYVRALISEIKIMAFIGDHQNIAKFIGTCINDIRQGKIYAAVEFCEKGDLRQCLQKEKAQLIVSKGTTDGYTNTEKYTSQGVSGLPANVKLKLLQWSLDIASGMAFISSKNVIHGDLAARNVLLTKDSVAKISDFGLARQLLNDYSVYTKKTKEPLPWKWMAIESLTSSKFSVQSDVWAFGVTLWEIFSFGDSPYPGYRYNEEFLQKLSTGSRPLRPQFASDEIFNIMERCWSENPQMRPDMSKVCDQLHQQLRNANTRTTINYVDTCQSNETALEEPNA